MNSNLLLTSISFPLARNKMDEVKQVILSLPWIVKENKEATEKIFVAPNISGRWVEMEPSLHRRFWFRTIELFIQDYIIILTSQDTGGRRFNRLSWKMKNDVLASSKEW